jgi:hypothetical protein
MARESEQVVAASASASATSPALLAGGGVPDAGGAVSLESLAADTFESDEELEEFLVFTRSERQRDVS